MLYSFETLKQVIDMCVDTYADHFVSNVPLISGRIAVLSEEESSFGGMFYPLLGRGRPLQACA